MRNFPALFGLIVLAACGGAASHLPNPLLLPAQGLQTAIGNAAYNSRRGKLGAYVSAHHAPIMAQVRAGRGPQLDRALDLAGALPRRAEAVAALQADAERYDHDAEALIVALMVHGGG